MLFCHIANPDRRCTIKAIMRTLQLLFSLISYLSPFSVAITNCLSLVDSKNRKTRRIRIYLTYNSGDWTIQDNDLISICLDSEGIRHMRYNLPAWFSLHLIKSLVPHEECIFMASACPDHLPNYCVNLHLGTYIQAIGVFLLKRMPQHTLSLLFLFPLPHF